MEAINKLIIHKNKRIIMKKLILVSALIVLSYSSFYAQTFGKIFTKEQADQLYGKAVQTATMDIATFRSVLEQTKNILMYAIVDGEIILAGEGRKVLYPVNKSIPDKTVLNVASKKVVQELINQMNAAENSQVLIEKRAEVSSITYENYTVEQSTLCPPFCP